MAQDSSFVQGTDRICRYINWSLWKTYTELFTVCVTHHTFLKEKLDADRYCLTANMNCMDNLTGEIKLSVCLRRN